MKKLIFMAGAITALLILIAGCNDRKESAPPLRQEQPKSDGTIVAVGDSLTAGLGVSEHEAYPAQLEKKLRAAGYNWQVINAGISGETSSGTLARVTWVLKLKPEIVILETGANDGLRGIDPRITRGNLDKIVRILKQNHVTVILAGMRMVTNMGTDFTREFFANYSLIAKKHNLILIPFILEGVAGEPDLNQADGIHPTAEGYRRVTETVYPFVLAGIKREKQP